MARADGDGDNWIDAIDRALERNARNGRPSSLKTLAAALAEQSGGHPTRDSWLTDLKRIRRENRATEEKAQAIAAALGVSRRSLPASTGRLKLTEVDRRLRVVEERGVQVEDLAPLHHVLQLLANGKRAEALRALSELEGP